MKGQGEAADANYCLRLWQNWKRHWQSKLWSIDNDALSERYNKINFKRMDELAGDNILKVLYDIVFIIGNSESDEKCIKALKASLLIQFNSYEPYNIKEHKEFVKNLSI